MIYKLNFVIKLPNYYFLIEMILQLNKLVNLSDKFLINCSNRFAYEHNVSLNYLSQNKFRNYLIKVSTMIRFIYLQRLFIFEIPYDVLLFLSIGSACRRSLIHFNHENVILQVYAILQLALEFVLD